jgi:hypothetical protein
LRLFGRLLRLLSRLFDLLQLILLIILILGHRCMNPPVSYIHSRVACAFKRDAIQNLPSSLPDFSLAG